MSLKIRALLGTASHFCEVVVLEMRMVQGSGVGWFTAPTKSTVIFVY